MEPCDFCGISDHKYGLGDVDVPIFRDKTFMTIASIGALVDGWTLVVPLKHQLSMRELYVTDDFKNHAKIVAHHLLQQLPRIIAFEHGPNTHGSVTGCGTNHAHFHMIPYSGSLISLMHSGCLDWQRCTTQELNGLVGEQEYLYYVEIQDPEEIPHAVGYYHILREASSQYFRKLIAKDTGQMDIADYRLFPLLETARRTRTIFEGA